MVDIDPATFRAICDLLADFLQRTAAARADNDYIATLERNYADVTAALGGKAAEADDEILTVTEAAKLRGVSTVTIRKYVKKYGIGARDPHAGLYLISKRKLLAVPEWRGVSVAKQLAP